MSASAPAGSDVDVEAPYVPVQSRAGRLHSADPEDFGPLRSQDPGWKYTPLIPVAALADHTLDGTSFPIGVTASAGVRVSWVPFAEASVGTAGLPEDRVHASAWAATDQVLLVEATGDQPEQAIIVREDLGERPRAAHTLIATAPDATATVVLDSTGSAQLLENIEIVVADHSALTVVSVQDWADDAVHLSAHFARLGEGATLKHIVVTLGGGLVRLAPSIHLAGRRSATDALGLYFSGTGQFFEQQVYVHHDAPDTVSNVTYKGALQGHSARAVWIGDVLIGPAATGTDSYEQNRNLVLSDGARADSVPNLEIETGDILGAGHASATGRFDDEQLFYLESRGIPEAEARQLVVRGFFSELIQKIGVPELEERLIGLVERKIGEYTVSSEAKAPVAV